MECIMASTIVEVRKNKNENSLSLIKRFSRKVRGTGILRAVRAKRYHERDMSEFKKKQSRLRNLTKKAEYEKLKKLGKLPQ